MPSQSVMDVVMCWAGPAKKLSLPERLFNRMATVCNTGHITPTDLGVLTRKSFCIKQNTFITVWLFFFLHDSSMLALLKSQTFETGSRVESFESTTLSPAV